MGADRVSSICWLAFGLLCIYGSVLLGLGTLREPGTGFFPLLAGCFFTLLALVVFVRSLIPGRGFQARISSLWKGTIWHRPLAVGLLMTGYILALERIGFLLTSLDPSDHVANGGKILLAESHPHFHHFVRVYFSAFQCPFKNCFAYRAFRVLGGIREWIS